MQISVSTRHGHLNEDTKEKIQAKVERLSRYFERLTAIEVIIDLSDSEHPTVDLNVSAEHKHDFVASDGSTDLMASIDSVVHKMEQQLRKYKEKVQDRNRGGGVRHQEVPTDLEPDEN